MPKRETRYPRDARKAQSSPHRLFDSPDLRGRERELAFLENYLDSARDGQGHFVLISGEAGIGKTCLVEELKRRAGAAGKARILSGACTPEKGNVPYYLFGEVFASGFDNGHGCEENGQERIDLFDGAPDSGESSIPFRMNSSKKKSLMDDPDLARRKMFYNVYEALVEAASETPLLIILEDIHWAGPSSLQLLHFITRNIARAKILIVATYRSEELIPEKGSARNDLNDVLRRMNRELLFEKLELIHLSRSDTDALLRGYFPQAHFSEAFLSSVYGRTRGNPYLVKIGVELLLSENGIVESDGVWLNPKEIEPDAVPETLPEAIRRCLDSFEDISKSIVECAATIGQKFYAAIVSEVLGLSATALSEMFGSINQYHCIIRTDRRDHGFNHPAIMEVLYRDMSEDRRRTFHEKIGMAMEKVFEDTLDSKVDELAFHFVGGGDQERAFHFLEQAGKRAEDLLAYKEALSYFETAVSILRKIPAIRDRESREMDIIMHIGKMNQAIDRCDRSLDDFRRVLQLSTETKNRKTEAQALMQIGLACAKLSMWSEAESFYEMSIRLFQRIGKLPLIGLTKTRIADIYLQRCKWQRAEELYEEALTMAMRMVDKGLMAKIYNNLATISDIRGDLLEAMLNYSKSLDLFRETDDYLGMAQVYYKLGILHANRKEWNKSIDFYDRSIVLSKRIGELGQTSLTYLNKGLAAIHTSDVAQAEECCNLAGLDLIKVDDPLCLAECNKILGLIGVQQKEWHYAQRRFEESIRIFESCNNLLGLAENFCEMGKMYAAQDLQERALNAFERSMNLYKELGIESHVGQMKKMISDLTPHLAVGTGEVREMSYPGHGPQ